MPPSGRVGRLSGFNPSDEVGQSRADYAAGQLQGVTIQLDKTNFDPQKFAAQVASGNVPDLLQMDRSVVATLADKELIIPLVYAVPQFFQPSALIANKRVAYLWFTAFGGRRPSSP